MILDLLGLKKSFPHFPVLVQEVLRALKLSDNNEPKVYLDCTFGAGCYSRLILQHSNASIIALDRDDNVRPFTEELRQQYPDRFSFYHSVFSNYPKILEENKLKVDGIIMDLGFSSMQVNNASRGFSFKHDGGLSMKMGLNSLSANEFINKASETLLADVIFNYGEERKARQIAKTIVDTRKKNKIETTLQLATLVRQVVGFSKHIDPATRTFQAIRIYVNDELRELKIALDNSLQYLNKGGILAVVSFHSLEDRIVKEFFNSHGIGINRYNKLEGKELDTDTVFTIYKPINDISTDKFKILTKKPILPTAQEIFMNKPSSSAKLRVGEKI